MSRVLGFMHSLRSLLHRSAANDDTAEEIADHIARQTRKHVAAGLDPAAARALAVNEFGGADRWREEVGDARAGRFLDSIGQDARYATRTLRRHRGFTVVAVLTLAIGIGGTVASFTLVDQVLLRPLPYREPERLVQLVEANESSDALPFSVPNLVDLRAQARSFSAIGGAMLTTMAVDAGDQPADLLGASITGDFFDALGVGVFAGRALQAEDGLVGAPLTVVLGYELWSRRFSRDRSIIGRRVPLGAAKYTVVGVARPGFTYPEDAQFWIACRWCANPPPRSRATILAHTVARLARGVSIERARVEVETIAKRIHAEFPDPSVSQMTTARALPLRDAVIGDTRGELWMLGAAVCFVLIIGCANLASANLARNASRLHELILRSALGAARRRIVQQLVVESLILSLGGAVAGMAIAWWSVRLVARYGVLRFPRLSEVHLDGRSAAFAVAISAVVTLIIGALPALQLSSSDLRGRLAAGERGTAGRRGSRARDAMIVCEVALSVVLVVAAGLAVRSLQLVYREPIGVDPHGLFVVVPTMTRAEYGVPGGALRFQRALVQRIAALPGVSHAAVTSTAPLEMGWTGSIAIDGDAATSERRIAQFNLVGDDYFATLGLRLLHGRLFSAADDSASVPTTVINRAMAERYWPGTSPLGARIRALNIGAHPDTWLTVVGVVSNVRTFSLELEDSPIHYVSLRQQSELAASQRVVVRADRSVASLYPEVRDIVRALDPAAQVQLSTVDERIAFTTSDRRMTTTVLGAFAGVALLLVAIGIYGVLSYTVSLRSREFGIRMALGADAATVVRTTLSHIARPVALGLVAGLAGARLVSHVMQALVFHLSPTEPAIFAAAGASLLVLALFAAYLPARRAARVDPLAALRAH